MKNFIFHTNNSFSPLFIRVLLSIVLFPHGAQKLMGWFGGYGFEGSMAYFTQAVGLPWLVGFGVIMIEFFGPIFLLFGLATRLWSFAIVGVMFGIIITTVHDFFFMNWFGNQPSEGFEFFLLAIGMSLSLVFSGAGRISLDAMIIERISKSYKEVYNLTGVRT